MDDVRSPSELLDCLKHTAGKEYGPFPIVLEELAVLVAIYALAMEIVLIVNEIDLHSCSGYGGNLDYKRPVYIVDDDVHTGESDDLVQLVFPFVNAPIAWHEGPDFLLPFLNALRKVSSDVGDV